MLLNRRHAASKESLDRLVKMITGRLGAIFTVPGNLYLRVFRLPPLVD